MAEMPGAWCIGIDFRHRTGAADSIEHAAVEQALDERHQLNFLTLLEKLLEHAVQSRMAREIKMFLGQFFLNRDADVFLRLLEHRRQKAFLRPHRMRERPRHIIHIAGNLLQIDRSGAGGAWRFEIGRHRTAFHKNAGDASMSASCE